MKVQRHVGSLALVVCLSWATVTEVSAQIEAQVKRPVPGPVVPPPTFRAALAAGSRDASGSPGEGYWQNHSFYQIEATLSPVTGELHGSATIEYHNQAPAGLPILGLHLYQNLHASGGVRSEPQEITGGVNITRIVVDSVELHVADTQNSVGYSVDGTALWIRPLVPLLEGESTRIEIDWNVVLPENGAGRMGNSDREMYFVAYWFPKMGVLDDLNGWDIETYQGGAEFFDEYGDYEVALTVPSGWTVMATGELQNSEEVLTTQTRDRLAAAASSDTVVRVASSRDLKNASVTQPGSFLTYRFSAENVRDFTFTTSNVQTWDATSAVVPDRDGDGIEDRVLIHSFWRGYRAPLWTHQAMYGKHAIEHHSRYTGFAYPWSHMTSVEGADIIGGGMEFPMLTLIGDYSGNTAEALYNVTAHEIAHMWIPMIVGSNEKRYAWMDEGSTTFLENHGRPEFWAGSKADSLEMESYAAVARSEAEQPLMRHGDYYEPGPGYGTASYAKPATLLVTLRNLLGEEVFLEGYRTFISEWAFKHPTPWDLFHTFERVAGTDLDWFWSTWYYETWSHDLAVGEVRNGDGGSVVVIEDRGFAPMPVTVEIRTARGGVLREIIPVSAWLGGETEFEIQVPAEQGNVVFVMIDPERSLPDVDRSNNGWRGGE